MSRSCVGCYSDFRTWTKARSHRDSNSSGGATPTGDKGDGNIPGGRAIAKKTEREQKSMAESFGYDWSTF